MGFGIEDHRPEIQRLSLEVPELRKRAQRILIIYAFSPSNIVSQLQRYGLHTLRAPVALEHIWQQCQLSQSRTVDWQPPPWDPKVASDDPIPPKRFSRDQLVHLSNVTTSIACECPHHMATVIEQLSAFEDYSARCEVATKQDAAIHGYLHQMTARARWIMELALEKLAEVENIDVNDPAGNRATRN